MTIPIPELATIFALVFARVGTLVMLLPGVGEQPVPARMRLSFALFLALLVLPVARPLLPTGTPGPSVFAVLIGEIAVGLVLGLAARAIVSALQTAGTVISGQLGLTYATTIDPTISGQDAALANFLSLLGVTLVFATDLHHVAISAIGESYRLLPPVGLPEAGDAARLALEAVTRGFALGVKISAPFIVFGVLLNLGLGVLSRLMPQVQAFILGLPLTILVGMLVLFSSLGLMMGLYLNDLGGFLRDLGSP